MKDENDILNIAKMQKVPEGYKLLGADFKDGQYVARFWKGSIGAIDIKEVDITREIQSMRKVNRADEKLKQSQIVI